MELKKGYKQTEVGFIPSDWLLKVLKEICWVNQGLQIAIQNRFKDPTEKSKIYITIQFLNDGKEIEYINEYSQSVCCEKKDILMTRTGNTGIVVHDVEGVFHNNFFKINFDKNQVVRDYLVYYLKDKNTQKIILNRAGISTIPDLNHNDFYSIPIPLPPTKSEQTAIANALSDADAYISSLEKLIEKKRNIKQGAMQQLLKPKKGWEIKRLGEVLKVKHGKSQKGVEEVNGQYPILGTGGQMGVTDHFLYDKPSVLIGRKGTIDKPQFMERPFWTVDTLFYTEVFIGYNVKYIYYIFNLIDWYSFNEASGVPSLNAKTIEKIEKFFPSLLEQNKIAQILSDIDNEITSLETKLTKAKQIKQGMMQELLTGKIRLV